MLDFYAKALTYEGRQLTIGSGLEQRSERFPIRSARGKLGDITNAGAEDGPDFLF
jgi:hypothetical protein